MRPSSKDPENRYNVKRAALGSCDRFASGVGRNIGDFLEDSNRLSLCEYFKNLVVEYVVNKALDATQRPPTTLTLLVKASMIPGDVVTASAVVNIILE